MRLSKVNSPFTLRARFRDQRLKARIGKLRNPCTQQEKAPQSGGEAHPFRDVRSLGSPAVDGTAIASHQVARPCELVGTNSKPWQSAILLQWLAKMRESGSPWVGRLHHSRPGAQDAKTAIEPALVFRGRRLCMLAFTAGCRLLIRSGYCARASAVQAKSRLKMRVPGPACLRLKDRLTMHGSIRPTENPMSKLSGIGTSGIEQG